ncbi:MAG: hypothetical protein DHS20C15_16440 [Planctomycetota bacterium]|nr:MAG: hypothetical protein DHS20C15_16440 [Planctomycetota bacterium]
MSSACAYPWQQMNIDLTGEVVPCCFWSGYGNSGKPLGNTNEQSIDEIWNGEAYRELRAANASGDPPEGHPCRGCIAWKWGGGNYPGFSWPVSFRAETGHAWVAEIPERFREAVEASDDRARFFEDGVELPEPDDVHDTIRSEGGGRYSVWGNTLYFSSSDNSDPSTNGRTYELRCGDARFTLKNLRDDSASGHNILEAHHEFVERKEVMQAKPSMISFISTSDCNIDCPSCSQNLVRLLRLQHRPETELDVLAHVPYLHQLIWHGGEPYLIKRFREFVDNFRTEDNPNLTFGFTSNGTLLDEAELNKLEKFPRVNASVSVDSFTSDTFHAIRTGANFDNVLRNVQRAVARYEAPDRVFSVGMIINKLNVAELPANLRFAMAHGIGLNLSPVVVVPVFDRLDIFSNFATQTAGWQEALDEARAVIDVARAEGAVALRRVDPAGMIDALQSILDGARERYSEVHELEVLVEDPHGALPKMRHPGLIFARSNEHSHPLAYLDIPHAGSFRVSLPRAELRGERFTGWDLCHDLDEPMGILRSDSLYDSRGRSLHETDWSDLPRRVVVQVPEFEAPQRPRRNIRYANSGLSTADGRQAVSSVEMDLLYTEVVRRDQQRARSGGSTHPSVEHQEG